ncbi:MAG: hypothetical protein E7302_03760 [Butyrivibrio sp.]|nr:hypothetical protein [Butyrivibrio sp.]
MADENDAVEKTEETKEIENPEINLADLEKPEDLTVDGYSFLSKEDVEKAKLDKQKINILGQKVKSTKVSDLEAVYEKAISNKIFSTPVGWEYLAKLRDRLISAGVNEEDLTPIPITLKITNVPLPDEYRPRQYITPIPKKKRDPKTTMLLMGALNVILALLVIAMFLIAWLGETDNIINYKRNVTNRFAEWEQSLKEREKAVRIKERDLMIEDDTEYGEGIDLDEDTEENQEQNKTENSQN